MSRGSPEHLGRAYAADDRALCKNPPRGCCDRTILRQLTSNGRTSLEVLARAINLAPSSVKRRMDRLKRSGVIRGYTVLPAPDAFGNRLEVLMEITAVEGIQRGSLADALAAQPEIVRAWTGVEEPADSRPCRGCGRVRRPGAGRGPRRTGRRLRKRGPPHT
ncbi:Lrp/AsnC family transcriptional regulator [Nonomuraea sp. NPDC049695]|uniref:Lrp/AsnC family transcriptional regulator n=1 Tax=Nonomuraea sp. NPDC049695 TaxID=3154734 RepID=UPI003422D0F9